MTNLFLFLAGLAGLVVGAELLVRGASRLALALGVTPLAIGLTVVAFGTSSPELAVSLGAVWSGRTDMAVGGVVGSNIFNVLFILGLSALITPLVVHRQVVRQEVPIVIGASVLLLALSLDGRIDAVDGALLSVLLVAYTVFLVRQSRGAPRSGAEPGPPAPAAEGRRGRDVTLQAGFVVAGLVALVLGAQALVAASVAFARTLGVGELVIGLTIVAAGTSMPEVAASIAAAVKGERDIAVGNVMGSCMFNLLGCLGLPALLSGSGGLPVPQAALDFDLWVMLAAALACLPIFATGRVIARWEGAVFLLYYVAYVGFLALSASRHAVLGAFSDVMLSFVVPLTVVTLMVVLLRSPAAGR